eukprot:RCo038029
MHKYTVVQTVSQTAAGASYVVKRNGTEQLYDLQRFTVEPGEAAEALQREMYSLIALRHPNLVDYLETFQHEQSLSLVSERCAPALSFAAMIEASGESPLQEETIVDYIVGVAFALEYCHQRLVTHGNVSCENIYLAEGGRAKLGGFLTSWTKPTSQGPSVPTSDFSKGSPQGDLRGLGVVLVQLCTRASSAQARALLSLPDPLRAIRTDYSPDLASLATQLTSLSESPSGRGLTASKVLSLPFLQEAQLRILQRPIAPPVNAVAVGGAPPPATTPAARAPCLEGLPDFSTWAGGIRTELDRIQSVLRPFLEGQL